MTSSSSIITTALRSTLQNLARSDQYSSGSNTGSVASKSPSQGRVIQDVTDISSNAQTLNHKASELQAHLNVINRNVAVLESSGQAVRDVTAQLRKADVVIGRALAQLAQDANAAKQTSKAVLADFAKNFNADLNSIDSIVAKQDNGQVNLLRGDALETSFTGIANTSLVTQGADITREGLGFGKDFTFESLSDVARASDLLRSAIEGVKGLDVAFQVDLEEIQTKQDFAAGTVETLLAGFEGLGGLGQADEGANLLAQQASLLLASSDEALVSEEQQSLLNLF
ncbi:MAG: hypothetical protein CMH30_08665 [Micavibrio sp.]|nr:hypothetical protein [Micavibrio sp.]